MEVSNRFSADGSGSSKKGKRHRIGRVTIKQIPGSSKWHIEYCLNGKQERYTLKTSSLKQAKILAVQKDAELVLGTAKKPNRAITIFEAAEKYVASRDRRKPEETTVKICRRSLLFLASSRGIGESNVSTALVQNFLKNMRDSFAPPD